MDLKELKASPLYFLDKLMGADDELLDPKSNISAYLYGPMLVRLSDSASNKSPAERESFFINKKFSVIDSIITIFFITYKLDSLSVGDKKRKMTSVLKMIDDGKHYNSHSRKDSVHGFIWLKLEELRSYAISTRTLESAIISSSPIAIYERRLLNGEAKTKSEDNLSKVNDLLKDYIQMYNNDKLRWFSHMDSLLNTAANIPGFFDVEICNGPTFMEFISSENFSKWDDLARYYTSAFAIYMVEVLRINGDLVSHLELPNIHSEIPINMDRVIESITTLNSIANQNPGHIDTADVLRTEYDAISTINLKYEKSNNIGNSYKIDILRNFLTISHQYNNSPYVQSSFLKEFPNVKLNVIRVDEFYVSEFENRLLITPVIDMVDNNKMKLIILNKEGNISVRDTIPSV